MKTDELLASIEFGFDLEGFVEIVRCSNSIVQSCLARTPSKNEKQLAISGFSERTKY